MTRNPVLNIQSLNSALDETGTRLSASEVHGFITGWLGSGSPWQTQNEALTEILDAAPTPGLISELAQLAQATSDNLKADDFSFKVLLPDDDADINRRRERLSDWCRGFLAGFGLSGRYQQADLHEEVAEVLADFARIAQIEDSMDADDDNEADLIEIIEYVRMGAILVYTESGQQAIH